MSSLEILLFGTFQVVLNGLPLTGFRSDKSRALLTYLVIEHDRPHRREALAALLWPASAPQDARASLRAALHNLRQELAPWRADNAPDVLLIVTRQDVQFNAAHPACRVDKLEFDRLLAEHQACAHTGACHDATCQQRMARMVALYRGDLLHGLTLPHTPALEDWRMLQQELYHREAVRILDLLIRHHQAQQEYAQVSQYAQQQIALEPWFETPYCALMTALALQGQRDAALAQYHVCRAILQKELRVAPAPETTALYEKIRAGELGWEREPAPLGSENSPTATLPVDHNLPAPRAPRRHAFIWSMALLAVIVAGLALYALFQQGSARADQRHAQREAALAHSLNLATGAQLALAADKTDLALALALEANRLPDPPPQAQRVLAEAAYRPGIRRIFAGHTGPVRAVSLTADGRQALSASADGTLILWDMTTGELLRRFEGHTACVTGAAFLPGDHRALSASADGSLRVWDVATGAQLHQSDLQGAIASLAVNPAGVALAGLADGHVVLWDAATRSVTRRWRAHPGPVQSVALSPDDALALTSMAQVLPLWDRDDEAHPHRVDWRRALAAEGRGALPISPDATTALWELASGAQITGSRPDIETFVIAAGPSDMTLQMPTFNPAVAWLDIHSHAFLLRLLGHASHVQAVALTPDGRSVLAGADDGTVRLWDLYSGAEVRALEYSDALIAVTAVDISPDGRYGLAAFMEGSISVWEVASGAELCRLHGHTAMPFAGARFLPDSRRIVSGSGDLFGPSVDNTVRLWDIQTCRELQVFHGHTAHLWDIAVCPDGRFVASGAHDGTVRLWDLHTGSGEILFDVSPQAARSIAFSPDASLLALGLAKGASDQPDYAVRLVERATGQKILRYDGHTEAVTGLAFSPDGTQLVSGSNDHALIVWDVASGAAERRLVGHTESVYSVAFHPRGLWVASGSADASVMLWDIASGEALRRYGGHAKAVFGLAFAPAGATLFSGGDDLPLETVREWRLDLTSEALHDWIAANRHAPDLTCEQRAQYNVTPLCAP